MRYLVIVMSTALALTTFSAAASSINVIENLRNSEKAMLATAINNASTAKPQTLMVVADMYKIGMGTKADNKKAFAYYNQAAKLNYAPAQQRIAQFYLTGDGVKPDKIKGIQWLERAAKNGSSVAMTQLAVRYHIGDGVKQSAERYAYWTAKATEQAQRDSVVTGLPQAVNKPRSPRQTMQSATESSTPSSSSVIQPQVRKKKLYNDYGLDRL